MPPTRLAGLTAHGPGGLHFADRSGGCAIPTGVAARASAEASHALTYVPDHSLGAITSSRKNHCGWVLSFQCPAKLTNGLLLSHRLLLREDTYWQCIYLTISVQPDTVQEGYRQRDY